MLLTGPAPDKRGIPALAAGAPRYGGLHYRAYGNPYYRAYGNPYYRAYGNPYYRAYGNPYYRAYGAINKFDRAAPSLLRGAWLALRL